MDFRNRVKQETDRSREAERNGQTERANPESHGNLATSAIGRTCTRSNLKLRSRTSQAILSFVRVIRIYVYPFIAFGYVYTLGERREREREWEKERRRTWLCFYLSFTVSLPNKHPRGRQRKYFHCARGPASLYFRLRRSPMLINVRQRSPTNFKFAPQPMRKLSSLSANLRLKSSCSIEEEFPKLLLTRSAISI